jgi:hypothetical protein
VPACIQEEPLHCQQVQDWAFALLGNKRKNAEPIKKKKKNKDSNFFII